MPFLIRLALLLLAGASIALARKALNQQRNAQAAGSGLSTAGHPPAGAAPVSAVEAAVPYLASWPGQLPAARPGAALRP